MCIALFVSTLAKRLDGKTTPVILFVSKCFLYKDQIEELFIVVVILHVPTHNISTFSLISIFITAPYFSKAQYSQFVLKLPLNSTQSVSFFFCY